MTVPGGCRSQGCHGYPYAFRVFVAPPFFRGTIPQTYLLLMSLIYFSKEKSSALQLVLRCTSFEITTTTTTRKSGDKVCSEKPTEGVQKLTSSPGLTVTRDEFKTLLFSGRFFSECSPDLICFHFMCLDFPNYYYIASKLSWLSSKLSHHPHHRIYRIYPCISRPFMASKEAPKIVLDLYTGQRFRAKF